MMRHRKNPSQTFQKTSRSQTMSETRGKSRLSQLESGDPIGVDGVMPRPKTRKTKQRPDLVAARTTAQNHLQNTLRQLRSKIEAIETTLATARDLEWRIALLLGERHTNVCTSKCPAPRVLQKTKHRLKLKDR